MNVKDITWDDLAVELNKTADAFAKAIVSFNSLVRTYQELIDWCEAYIQRISKL